MHLTYKPYFCDLLVTLQVSIVSLKTDVIATFAMSVDVGWDDSVDLNIIC